MVMDVDSRDGRRREISRWITEMDGRDLLARSIGWNGGKMIMSRQIWKMDSGDQHTGGIGRKRGWTNVGRWIMVGQI